MITTSIAENSKCSKCITCMHVVCVLSLDLFFLSAFFFERFQILFPSSLFSSIHRCVFLFFPECLFSYTVFNRMLLLLLRLLRCVEVREEVPKNKMNFRLSFMRCIVMWVQRASFSRNYVNFTSLSLRLPLRLDATGLEWMHNSEITMLYINGRDIIAGLQSHKHTLRCYSTAMHETQDGMK